MLKGKSILDQLVRRVVSSCFFSGGVGELDMLWKLESFHKTMSKRELCAKLVVPEHTPVTISGLREEKLWTIVTGCFESPFVKYCPGFLPPEAETSRFEFCIPKEWKTDDKPVAIHLAGTGDHHFWRRRLFMAKALAKEYGIGSLMIENPFYGSRKPKGQTRSSLLHVSDIFVMGGGLILESIAILHWLEQHEFGPFCLTGISMGGHMASLAASNWPKAIPLVPCLSWTSASAVFTRGVMSQAVDWKSLEDEFSLKPELRRMLMPMLSNFDIDNWDDVIQIQAELIAGRRAKRTKSVLKQAVWKVTKSLGLAKLISNRSNFFPIESSSSEPEYNPGKSSSFPLARFSFLEKAQTESDGRTGNFDSEFNIQGNQTRRSRRDRRVNFPFPSFFRIGQPPDRKDTVEFMRRVMDHFTHLGNYSTPMDPELIIVVVARDDAYVLREGLAPVDEVWRGCEVRVLNEGGHVYSCLAGRGAFRKAINDSINRYRAKYNRDGTLKKPADKQPDSKLE